jgi:hypothetical protein
MRLPVDDAGLEDGREQGIGADARIEGADQAVQHRLVEPGPRDDIIDDLIAPLGRRHVVCPFAVSTAPPASRLLPGPCPQTSAVGRVSKVCAGGGFGSVHSSEP